MHIFLRSAVLLWTMLPDYTKADRQSFRAQDPDDAIAWAVTEDAVLGRYGWFSVILKKVDLYIDPFASKTYS